MLVAIYNAWGDCVDLLEKSVENILPVVDRVLIVYSEKSNRGHVMPFKYVIPSNKISLVRAEPVSGWDPVSNEKMKRNIGIEKAREIGATYFIMMDCDEFYLQSDIVSEFERVKKRQLNGLVCRLKVYIKEPTLWCEDITLVPFIQKMTMTVSMGGYKWFPYAYDRGTPMIDPTRRPSHTSKIGWSDIFMHHFSYVRKDIMLKINNSTANLSRSKDVILEDLKNAKPGYESKIYHRVLNECEDIFKIKGPS